MIEPIEFRSVMYGRRETERRTFDPTGAWADPSGADARARDSRPSIAAVMRVGERNERDSVMRIARAAADAFRYADGVIDRRRGRMV
jgi:hypothetical protein